MFYSYRGAGRSYRVGTAVSEDGLRWAREPAPLLDIGQADWDSEMVCYACPLVHEGTTYLFYNGNAYGEDGFGVATVG